MIGDEGNGCALDGRERCAIALKQVEKVYKWRQISCVVSPSRIITVPDATAQCWHHVAVDLGGVPDMVRAFDQAYSTLTRLGEYPDPRSIHTLCRRFNLCFYYIYCVSCSIYSRKATTTTRCYSQSYSQPCLYPAQRRSIAAIRIRMRRSRLHSLRSS